jgi:hypothetical protein
MMLPEGLALEVRYRISIGFSGGAIDPYKAVVGILEPDLRRHSMENCCIFLLLCAQFRLSRPQCGCLGPLQGEDKGSHSGEDGHHAGSDKQRQAFGCQVRLGRHTAKDPPKDNSAAPPR